MRLPFKNSFMKVRYIRPKFIILHHTWCNYNKYPELKVDNASYQMPSIWKSVLEKKEYDINYHYIIERIRDEYIPFVCRPLSYICDYPDIEHDTNRYSLHIAILGNYDIAIPDSRLYSIMAYKVLNPLMKIYGLTPARLFLHNEVSSNKELSCPGDFFDLDRLVNQIRRFIIK